MVSVRVFTARLRGSSDAKPSCTVWAKSEEDAREAVLKVIDGLLGTSGKRYTLESLESERPMIVSSGVCASMLKDMRHIDKKRKAEFAAGLKSQPVPFEDDIFAERAV